MNDLMITGRQKIILIVPLCFLLLVSIVILILNIPIEVIDQDEAMYALVALDLLESKLPFQGVFDHKPVGIYYIYAGFFSVFGSHYLSIRIATLAAVIIAVGSVAFSLKKLNFSSLTTFAAVVTVLAFPLGLDGSAGNTEIFLTAVMSLIFYLYVSAEQSVSRFCHVCLFIVGACVAIGFSINYLFSILALFTYIGYGVYLLLDKQSLGQVLIKSVVIFIGFVVGTLLIYTPYLIDYFKGGDLLADYLYQQTNFLQGYKHPLNKKVFIEKWFVWFMPFSIVLVGAFMSLFYTSKDKKLVVLVGLLGLLATVITATMSRTFFNHYWVLACLPIALCVAVAVDQARQFQQKAVMVYVVSISLFGYLVNGSELVVNHNLNKSEAAETNQAFQFIEQTIPNDARVASILVTPAYFFVHNLQYSQKYVFPNHIPILEQSNQVVADQYYTGILAENPDFVITDDNLCIETLVDDLSETCQVLDAKFEKIASFQGWWPADVYRIQAHIPTESVTVR